MTLRSGLATFTDPVTTEVTAALMLDTRDDADRYYVQTTTANTRTQSSRSWLWYERIGEVRYAVNRSARLAGYTTLVAMERNRDGSLGERVTNRDVMEIVNGIYSPFGGIRHLFERFYTLRKVAGDMWLVRTRDDNGDPNGYMLLSSDELDTSELQYNAPSRQGMLRWWTLPASGRGNPDQGRLYYDILPEDFIGRLWNPSARYVGMPESPMMALDTECEVLYELTESLKSKIQSRFALAGMMFIPSEINDIRVSGATTDQRNPERLDQFTRFLVEAMTRNVRDRSSAESRVPIVVRGPGEFGDKIKTITIDNAVWETDIALRAELLNRIMAGLDQQQDAVQGVGSSNHWSAWAVSDEERRVSVQPDVEAFCWALTRMVLHAELAERGWDADRIAKVQLWYDMSGAATRANQQEDARQTRDRYALSDSALRRSSGFTEDDAPTEAEYVRQIGAKIGDPYLAMFELDVTERIDWSKVGMNRTKPGPKPMTDADETPVGPGVGQPGSPDDIDSDTPRTERPV